MRRWAKVDKNHAATVKALRAAGYSVLSLASMGKGCPDLLVGAAGINVLIEVKRPELMEYAPKGLPEKIQLREQQEWRDKWRGPVCVAYGPEEALEAVRLFLEGAR